MTRGQKVLSLRREKGKEWTQEKLAAELRKAGADVNRGWVAHLETDRARVLYPQDLRALSRVFGKPESFFSDDQPGAQMLHDSAMLYQGPAPEPASGYAFIEVPFLGVVSASRFSFSFDLPPEHFTTLAVRGGPGERYAMLRISGDCMAPRIEDGDEVLIKQTDQVQDGAIAIVCWDGECTMKRVYKKADGIELRPDNTAYKPRMILSSKVRVLAEVVKIIKDPRKRP